MALRAADGPRLARDPRLRTNRLGPGANNNPSQGIDPAEVERIRRLDYALNSPPKYDHVGLDSTSTFQVAPPKGRRSRLKVAWDAFIGSNRTLETFPLTAFNASSKGYDAQNVLYMARASRLSYLNRDDILRNKEAMGFDEVHLFRAVEGNRDAQVVLGVRKDAIIVSHGGTDSLTDLITDLTPTHIGLDGIRYEGQPVVGGGSVHRGFLEQTLALWQPISDEVRKLIAEKNLPFFLTGHSLGGAMAVIAASRALTQDCGDIRGLYTFGQPKVGDQAFLEALKTRIVGPFVRVRNHKDLVPKLGPESMGFTHGSGVSIDIVYNAQGDVWRDAPRESCPPSLLRDLGDLARSLYDVGYSISQHDLQKYISSAERNLKISNPPAPS